jgi:hypothetical protein
MGKKTYTSPQLFAYGRVEEITRGQYGGWIDACIGQIDGISDGTGGIRPRRPPQDCPWGGSP